MNGNMLIAFLVFWPMAAALISYLIGRVNKQARCLFADATVIVEFAVILYLLFNFDASAPLMLEIPEICGMGLFFKLDGFRVLYVTIAVFMWMMSTIFTREYIDHSHNKNRYYMFILFTLGATVGVFLSVDLFTTFIFFEMMSVASYTWVAHEETPQALRAAGTYLAVAIIGGMVTLMGIFLLYTLCGTLNMDQLMEAVHHVWDEKSALIYLSGALILFGFGAKAGAYPIHIWLPKAHPVAPAPASALLSGILTKTGVFGAIVLATEIFHGNGYWGFIMLMIGVVTMFWGGMLALFSNDLKRTLACSSVSQIGFIFVGIGMQGLLGHHNALAVRGTFLHMMNHSLIKLVLFMAAGVVFMNLHALDLNKIRGFGRKKPVLNFAFLMGALGVGGIPLWNGYVSKTLLHESIVEYIELIHHGEQPLTFAFASGHGAAALFSAIEWIFLITGGMTVAYMLKLYICLFIEKNVEPGRQEKMDAKKQYMNKESMFALAGSAIVLPILGAVPSITMDRLADMAQTFMHGESPAHAVHYYAFVNLKGGLISITLGILIYVLLVRKVTMRKTETGAYVYVDRWPAWLDLENTVYRPVILNILPTIGALIGRCADYLMDIIILIARKTTHKQLKLHKQPREGIRIGYYIGLIVDWVMSKLNRTILKNRPAKTNNVVRFAIIQKLILESGDIVRATLSYSLVMLGIGVVIVVLYLVR